MRPFLFFGLWLWPLLLLAGPLRPPRLHPDPETARQTYRRNLTDWRGQYANRRDLPDSHFFLFGMGNRRKLIYQAGKITDAQTGEVLHRWPVKTEVVVPSEYLVHLITTDGQTIQLREDEQAVWLLQPGTGIKPTALTVGPISLPAFGRHPFGPVLRVLHHEILINVIAGKPVPNFLVYARPWYRDATLMAMVLKQTGNLALIRDWILALRDPFDRNNHGISEADNPGQVLYLLSLVADKRHPAVAIALDSVRQFITGDHIAGKTDYAQHPVFQTKWLKYGLQSLGLPDPYRIPAVYDSYSSLFWWAFREQHVPGKQFDRDLNTNYPYLLWAEDHFFGQHQGMTGNLDYPLSWEQRASDARYVGMAVVNPDLVSQKLSYPHTWHTAEMFLFLTDTNPRLR